MTAGGDRAGPALVFIDGQYVGPIGRPPMMLQLAKEARHH